MFCKLSGGLVTVVSPKVIGQMLIRSNNNDSGDLPHVPVSLDYGQAPVNLSLGQQRTTVSLTLSLQLEGWCE